MEGEFLAKVQRNELVAQATVGLSLRFGPEVALDLAPGHTVALVLPDGARRPYAVNRVRPAAREIDLLIRVVRGGRVSPRIKELPVGSEVLVEAAWGVPIADRIAPDASAVIGISTGTGVGPLLAFAAESRRRLTLVAGFRTAADLCVEEVPRGLRLHLSLSQPGPGWIGLRGHSVASAPPVLDDLVGAHVHLVGNGRMVRTWTEAIYRSDVPVAGVSAEVWFDRTAPVDPGVVERLATALRRRGEQLGRGAASA